MPIITPTAGDRFPSVASTATIKLDTGQSGGRLSVIEHEVDLGAGPPPHTHTHEEVILVLDGTHDVLLGNDRAAAQAGDLVHVPAGVVHTTRCTSPEGGRLLTFYAPGGGEGFFREASSLTPGDAAAMLALAAKYDTHIVPPAG